MISQFMCSLLMADDPFPSGQPWTVGATLLWRPQVFNPLLHSALSLKSERICPCFRLEAPLFLSQVDTAKWRELREKESRRNQPGLSSFDHPATSIDRAIDNFSTFHCDRNICPGRIAQAAQTISVDRADQKDPQVIQCLCPVVISLLRTSYVLIQNTLIK